MKKSFMKLHGAMALMMKRIGELSNDPETIRILQEGKQNLEIAYSTRYPGLIYIINSVKCFDQLCMLGDLARKMCEVIDLDEEYQRIKDMPEAEDMHDVLYDRNHSVMWLANQIEHYNMPVEDVDYDEECCSYYEYSTNISDAKVMLKVQRVYTRDWDGRNKTHTEITVTANYKTYFKEYVITYNPKCYDKSALAKSVEATIKKAVEEIELD